MESKREITPQELLTKIKNQESISDVVVTYDEETTPKQQKEALIDALKHQNCPENFTLHVGRISSVAWEMDKGHKELIQHLSSELQGEKNIPSD